MIIRPVARSAAVILIAMMILNLSPISPIRSIIPVHAQATPELFIAPSHHDLAPTGNTVTFDVNVSNISSRDPVAGWSVIVQTNVNVLNPVSIALGSFLAGATELAECINSQCTGAVWDSNAQGPGVVGSLAYASQNGNSGNGTLFTITYTAVGGPYTLVNFVGGSTDTYLSDNEGGSITVNITDGDYGNVPPLPVANFTFSPLQPFTGEPVAFNASMSSAPPGHTITDYLWTFAGASRTQPLTTPITSYTFTQPGDLSVSLVVEDDRGLGFRSHPFQRTIPVALKPLIQLSIAQGLSIYPIDNILPGGIVSIKVLVLNLGTDAETGFNVWVSVEGNNFTAPPYTAVVPPTGQGSLSFKWNTTGVVPDVYTVRAHLSPLPGENITADNDAYGSVRVIYPFQGAPVSISVLQLLGIGFLALIAVAVSFGALSRIRDRRLSAKQDIL